MKSTAVKSSKQQKADESAKAIAPVARDKNALQVQAKRGESADMAISKALTSPQVTATLTMREFDPTLKQQDVNEMIAAISSEAQQVVKGEMGRAEEMLTVQAHTLDAIFNALAQRAARNMTAGHLQATDTYMRIALKAQSQCRSTLEALSEIKNPRMATFIKQQNVASQQQVNNGQASAHEKNITPPNELLTGEANATVDTARSGTSGRINQEMVAMAEVNRAKD